MGGRYGTANGTTTWTANDVPVHGGLNAFIVTATDAAGNKTTDRIEITVSSVSYTLAEGATGAFFDLDIPIANPNYTATTATVTFLKEDGTTITQDVTLEAMTRRTLHVDSIPGWRTPAACPPSSGRRTACPLVVERTMFWDASYYGSHGGTAVDGPRTRWLFAEGSEGFFNTFVLLANTSATRVDGDAHVPARGHDAVHAHASPCHRHRASRSRPTAIPELVGPLVLDRRSTPRRRSSPSARCTSEPRDSSTAATNRPACPAGATSWFLAEGATGPFFETFVLVGNPNPSPANVTMTFLTDGGQTVVRNKTVACQRPPHREHRERGSAVGERCGGSTSIVADQPVVVERAMYWPGPPSTWAEAHNSFGATTLALKWGLSEGRVGMAGGFQTYILMANPNPVAVTGLITFLRGSGAPIVKTFTVNPTSRLNVAVTTAVPELADEAFGALIEVTNDVPISVERAMYSNALGQIWAAGTNALATPVP